MSFAQYKCRACGKSGSYYWTKHADKTERCRFSDTGGMRCLGVLEFVSEIPKLPKKPPTPAKDHIATWQASKHARTSLPPPILEEEPEPMPRQSHLSEGARGGGKASARDPEFSEHPLFPYADDEDEFDVSFIQVTRQENGRQVYGPTCPASELQSELAIQEQYGGGVYVLLARRPLRSDKSKPGGVTKSRKLTLPGRPKPFSTDPTPEEAAAYDPALRASLPSPTGLGGMTGGGGFENVLIAMMGMQQQTAERAAAENRESARREAENSKAFMTMFLGMMQNSKADTSAMMTMMMNLSSQSQNSILQILPAMIGARGGGPEEMAKFAELFKTLGFAQPADGKAVAKDDDNSIGAILSNGADVLQGIIALKSGMGGAAPAVAANGHAALAPPVGSAAEMLERMKRGG